MIKVETMFHYSDGDGVFTHLAAVCGMSGMEVDGLKITIKGSIIYYSNDYLANIINGDRNKKGHWKVAFCCLNAGLSVAKAIA